MVDDKAGKAEQQQQQQQQQQQPAGDGAERPVRMRQQNGAGEPQRAGVDEATNSALNALQRSMGALQESEMENDVEEIKRLDNQLGHLNDYLGKTAAKLRDRHDRLAEQIEKQKNERQNKRASFHQRLAASREEDDAFAAQMAAMLGKCEQMRKTSAQAEHAVAGAQANGH